MFVENKHFIFDNPIKAHKYFLKQCAYRVKAPLYKLRLNTLAPRLSRDKKYYASICAIFKNEAPYLREWIEYHRIVGIEHFYLYNNFSEDDYQSVLQPYVDEGLVTLIEWPVEQGQMKAYADCAENYSAETSWIAFIDLDEFIVPNAADDIRELLKPFEKRPAVIAYWKLFGTSGRMDRDLNGLVTEDFFVCWRKYTNIGKCFYNTAYDYANDLPENAAMHTHWSRRNGRKLPPVNFYDHVVCNGINIADDDHPPVQINHYFTKAYEEYAKKRARGDAYFALNPRDEAYFFEHEMKCAAVDYSAYKYLIKLKLRMGL